MLSIIVGIVILLIIICFVLGYGYLFTAVRKTYLKGKTGAHIFDGQDFSSNIIENGNASPWEKAEDYNRRPLSQSLISHLNKTKSVSFLVIKEGKLLSENYWQGNNQASRTNSFSMAKSITVMLLGCAIQDKKIESTATKLSYFYPGFAKDPNGKDCTLGNLSTMESGLDWDENYANPFKPNAKAYYGDDLADFMLKRKFKAVSGTQFEYQSGTTQLLGFAVRKAIGESLSSYASEKLWKPLGMEYSAFWNLDRENGMEKTYCCINATSRDFAKFGQLLLNNGVYDGQQLLSSEFVQKMITGTKLSQESYGNGIWVNNDAQIKHYYLRGLYGQYVICIPDYNMIVVRTGSSRDEAKDSKERPEEVELFANEAVALFGK
ncbi:beta-lactamase family protein [Elizabethkingia anophelis]|uniref:serine hydrolase domain-containing protein n=1 Tax=Elizabethkingia anophelis TaxID=1117645 RepID=UPI000995621B|nr:serine hydrolase [Elizabethkingia anophelis]AQW97871.1 serine hydrolase [Elizabethkingia anophelis]AQX88435.1 serine hydrolase [Elizabethkingia anophelis]ASV77712.1 serine hydrolase [Elizabethkingia anophelis]EHM7983153.1 serine hydrolase [Elizabethkingia anophelis]EHM8031289.1 serine hydrolase [Elizabethkingia anophelis]